jgi:hypothetical protein
MQSWQIKALDLEASALKHLDGFIHEHALYFLMGAIYILLALLIWVLCGGLRPKGGRPASHVRLGIIIHLPGTRSPVAESFDTFPPLRDPLDYHCDCDEPDWN